MFLLSVKSPLWIFSLISGAFYWHGVALEFIVNWQDWKWACPCQQYVSRHFRPFYHICSLGTNKQV